MLPILTSIDCWVNSRETINVFENDNIEHYVGYLISVLVFVCENPEGKTKMKLSNLRKFVNILLKRLYFGHFNLRLVEGGMRARQKKRVFPYL